MFWTLIVYLKTMNNLIIRSTWQCWYCVSFDVPEWVVILDPEVVQFSAIKFIFWKSQNFHTHQVLPVASWSCLWIRVASHKTLFRSCTHLSCCQQRLYNFFPTWDLCYGSLPLLSGGTVGVDWTSKQILWSSSFRDYLWYILSTCIWKYL